MPNHVKNVLKFYKLKKKDIDFILETIATPQTIPTDPIEETTYAIDFNKIIPEPQILEDCPEDCRVNKDSHVEEDKDRPWFDWYTWRNKYWGTKWGAYDCYTIIGKSYIKFVFSTAWSMAYPVMERLHVLGYKYELKYADEDYGSNCGILIYDDDKTGFRSVCHYDERSDIMPNSEQFARRLWDKY